MYLILKTPSREYATAISHELWMLARPRDISNNETSQFLCGWYAHPDGTQVAIGPIDGMHLVHINADVEAFVGLIGNAITVEEAEVISAGLNNSMGSTISIVEMIENTPSIANNLITNEQMQESGWFPIPEEIEV